MSKFTGVFEISTVDQAEEFAGFIQEMKQVSPKSLKLLVAVTAEREVKFRGSGPAPSLQDDFAQLHAGLAEIGAVEVVPDAPVAAAPQGVRRRGRRPKRHRMSRALEAKMEEMIDGE